MKALSQKLAMSAVMVLGGLSMQADAATLSGPGETVANDFGGARIRYGQNNLAGAWEVGAGVNSGTTPFNQPGNQAHRVFQSGMGYDFTLSWDASAGTVTLDTDGFQTDEQVASHTFSSLLSSFGADFGPQTLFVALAANPGQQVSVSKLQLHNADRVQSFIETLNVNGAGATWKLGDIGGAGFEKLTGTFSFLWTDPSTLRQERPKVDFVLADAVAVPLPAALWGGLALLGGLGASRARRRQA